MPAEIEHLAEIRIQNYRGLDKFDATFATVPNAKGSMFVIAGPNGSGKTSVLEAIILALGRDWMLRSSAFGRPAVRGHANDYSIEAKFANEQGAVVRTVEKHSFERGRLFSDIPLTYFSSWRGARPVGGLPMTSGMRGKLIDKRKEENRLWAIKQYLINTKAHGLLRDEKRIDESSTDKYIEIVERLNRIWELFYPRSAPLFRVDEVSGDPSEGFDVFVSWEGQSRVALEQLSSGQQEIFSIFGWLVCEQSDGGIVIIDEPELHLDPSWHRLILQALRTAMPNSQFIIATHSPEIFESAYSFQRTFLSPVKPKLTKEQE